MEKGLLFKRVGAAGSASCQLARQQHFRWCLWGRRQLLQSKLSSRKLSGCDTRLLFSSSFFDFQEAQTRKVSTFTRRRTEMIEKHRNPADVLADDPSRHLTSPGRSTTDRVPSGRDLKSFPSRRSSFRIARSSSRSCVERTELFYCVYWGSNGILKTRRSRSSRVSTRFGRFRLKEIVFFL